MLIPFCDFANYDMVYKGAMFCGLVERSKKELIPAEYNIRPLTENSEGSGSWWIEMEVLSDHAIECMREA